MFLIEGKKLVQEAFQSDWNLVSVVAREDILDEWEREFPDFSFTRADKESFKQLTRMQQSEGILAVVSFPHAGFCSPEEPKELPAGQGFILDAVQDPGNLGTLMRSMDWMGIPNIILGPGCVDPLNLKSLRSTMGAVFRINIQVVSDLIPLLKHNPQRIYVADMHGAAVQDMIFSRDNFVLVGNEAQGISESIRGLNLPKVSIPRIGEGESLNAGVSGSLIAWEMAKRNL